MPIAFVSAPSLAVSAGAISNQWTGLTLSPGQRCLFSINKSDPESIASVSDNGSNAWTQLGIDIVDVPFAQRWSMWEGIITSSATTLTITYSAVSTGISPRLFLKQHTGVNQSIAGQVVKNRQPTPTIATDGMTSGTLVPAAQPGLLSGYGVVAFGALNAAGTGFTDRGEGVAAIHERFEDRVITSTAAVAATFTAAANNASTTVAVYWQEAPIVPSVNRIIFFG